MAGPLNGIRVLDLGRVAAGPFCGMILADLGAEVIRVEKSAGADDRFGGIISPSGYNYNFMTRNRNKKAISLNFEKNERAREILKELVRHADVIIENFSPEGAKVLGVTYDNFKAVKPDIVFAHISAFGAEGPYSRRLGFDPIAKAMSGMMSISGFPGSPPTRESTPYVDYSTAIYAAVGVLAALYDRKNTGQGQMIDVSLFQTAVTYMSTIIAAWETGKIRAEQVGNRTRYVGPADLYKSKDGRWVFVSTLTEAIWRRFCRFIGREDLITDPRSQNDIDRWEHRDVIDPIVSEWVASKTVEELIALGE
ncbi:CaiB/BaiF CoA transferase family protein, partial [Chloroflexota bacterium]